VYSGWCTVINDKRITKMADKIRDLMLATGHAPLTLWQDSAMW